MKMLGIVLVILFAHTINGQMDLSCNLTTDFPECIQAFLGAGNVTEGETIDLLCANSQCQTAIASFVNSCNTTDQEVSFEYIELAILHSHNCKLIMVNHITMIYFSYNQLAILSIYVHSFLPSTIKLWKN